MYVLPCGIKERLKRRPCLDVRLLYTMRNPCIAKGSKNDLLKSVQFNMLIIKDPRKSKVGWGCSGLTDLVFAGHWRKRLGVNGIYRRVA